MTIESGKVWRYVMEGVVPPGIPEAQTEAFVRSSVSWCDPALPHLRGSNVTFIDQRPKPSLVRGA